MTDQVLAGKVAIITGASRGIGRCVALKLAENGCNVVIAAKSVEEKPGLPGSIYTVKEEAEALGVKALALQVDVREDAMLEAMIQKTVDEFGRLDILINNAGALWWKPVVETPMKRFDLVHQVNARASFYSTQMAIPHMLKNDGGHVLTFSPPINLASLPGKVGYLLSKWGMTMLAHGLAQEMADEPFSINALWPATAIESQATINFKLGDPKTWRKADVMADAVLAIVSKKPGRQSGNAYIDEDLLREEGITDFVKYRCDPEHEPPRMMPNDFPDAGLVSDA
ncbi:MAG: SDR family oxidoreductase [Planctomycetota bacterium]|nr:SDR family oxidoreductase [Planctomycetota bacterium]